MAINAERARELLSEFALASLFVEELGWDRYHEALTVSLDDEAFSLRGVAEKRGMVVFEVSTETDGLPDRATRRKIERDVARSVHEHLIVYADRDHQTQIWQWVRRERGRPTACREQGYRVGQSGEALIQRLDALAFSLDEEADLTILDVTQRARAAFDVERVTRQFYDRFKTEHDAFIGFISGLQDQEDLEWYASVTLNRLMFIYFIQKKGFLDEDRDYLRHRLRRMQETAGQDQFLSFYRHFLLRLFHEGLARRSRASELDALIGRVPYLNGGLFEVHELERANPEIQIPDEAFERLFDFFDSYQWHLDDRPLEADNEVNPDVLGYIFEKYVNQKQMGAYYTKEDITGYITSRTVLPALFQGLPDFEQEFPETTDFAWELLRQEPDRYIPPELRHGCERNLPASIAAGLEDLRLRAAWDAPAPETYALPAETWRDVVNRRGRYQEINASLRAGEVKSVNDVITANLDFDQWAQDVVEGSDSPELVRWLYARLETLTILDPTCGSGAFLFAALNILEPLYDASLDRMQVFLADGEVDPVGASDFETLLERVGGHPSRTFFILKTIVLNNLYGVDIMEEAVEICKLRLFLKLVAQIDSPEDLEPLPDIDFNVRAGNTLVGFTSLDEVDRAVGGETQVRLDVAGAMEGITAKAVRAEEAFNAFHQLQLVGEDGDDDLRALAKEKVRSELMGLRSELDSYLAGEYGVNIEDDGELAGWRETHQPFHWLTEFYRLMRDGGFDAIIGNPPYLEVRRLGGRYRPLEFKTLSCRDIYAWVVERTFALRNDQGRIGLIVPVSLGSSGSFAPLRGLIESDAGVVWLSHFANRPGQLFAGGQNRLTIFLHARHDGEPRILSTRYHRWDARKGERDRLFSELRYVELGDLAGSFHGLLPKVGAPAPASILRKLRSLKSVSATLARSSEHPVHWVRVPGYFCQFYLRPPMARPEAGGAPRVRGEVNSILLPDEQTQRVLHAVLNSSTYYQFYVAYSDGRHINPADVREFPFDIEHLAKPVASELTELSRRLEDATRQHTSEWRKSGLIIDSLDSRPLKPLLDEIDAVLAKHYAFTDDELDFITSYDVKYRVGVSNEQ